MLTRKQLKLLRMIDDYVKHDGVAPTFEEMRDALAIRSKSQIHRLVTALEDRGFIRRLHNRARAIEVLRLPEAVSIGTPRPVRPDARQDDPRFASSAVTVLIRGPINPTALIELLQTHYGAITIVPDSSRSGALCTVEIPDLSQPPAMGQSLR